MSPSRVTRKLRKAKRDPTSATKKLAYATLAESDDPEEVNAALSHLSKDAWGNAYVRSRIVEALTGRAPELILTAASTVDVEMGIIAAEAAPESSVSSDLLRQALGRFDLRLVRRAMGVVERARIGACTDAAISAVLRFWSAEEHDWERLLDPLIDLLVATVDTWPEQTDYQIGRLFKVPDLDFRHALADAIEGHVGGDIVDPVLRAMHVPKSTDTLLGNAWRDRARKLLSVVIWQSPEPQRIRKREIGFLISIGRKHPESRPRLAAWLGAQMPNGQCLEELHSYVLARHEQDSVAALRILAEHGAPSSLPIVRAASRGLFEKPVIKRAAREALEGLQRTLAGKGKAQGSVSVVGDESERGGLSQADGDGKLSES